MSLVGSSAVIRLATLSLGSASRPCVPYPVSAVASRNARACPRSARWVRPGVDRACCGELALLPTQSSERLARVEGDFDLVEGDSLFILVGQNSQKAVSGTYYYEAPGGGGSYVAMGKTLAATTTARGRWRRRRRAFEPGGPLADENVREPHDLRQRWRGLHSWRRQRRSGQRRLRPRPRGRLL